MTTHTPDQILRAVTEVVEKIQRLSGRTCPTLLGQLQPIGDLEGFDSLNGLEATRLLEERLQHKLPTTVFLARDRNRALTVEEVSRSIASVLQGKESP